LETCELTILGLGPGSLDAMSLGAYRVVKDAGHILARTARHPAVDELRTEGIIVESLDHLYGGAEDFESVYEAVVETVLSRATKEPGLIYAVPGHPLTGERSVSLLLERAAERGISVRVMPSPGFIEAVLEAARASVDTDVLVLDAHSIESSKLDAGIPTIVYQVHDQATASAAKLVLMERYPDEHPVFLVTEGRESVAAPLFEMDRHEFDHLSSIYLPPVPNDLRKPTWDDLVRVISRLRAPGGCPWDMEQTHESLKRNMLEEAYEVVEAIERDDPAKLEEELGDLMMQPILHAVMAREDGFFTIDDVIAGITNKLIRRHPHVFGTLDVADSAEVLRNWEAIKKAEPGNAHRTSALDGVPHTMPALMRAMDISKKAVKVGFEWPDAEAVLDKVQEEVEELRAELRANDKARASDEIGDLLFALVNIARWLKIDPEESLRTMVDRFTARFQDMESMAAADERALKSLSAGEWDAYWVRAKLEE
jgi:tetrapyrrole methylase family protein / MazG family protein